jgi:hypothetical protein
MFAVYSVSAKNIPAPGPDQKFANSTISKTVPAPEPTTGNGSAPPFYVGFSKPKGKIGKILNTFVNRKFYSNSWVYCCQFRLHVFTRIYENNGKRSAT